MMLRERFKWWLFPGLNLHARLRNRVLPAHFGQPSNGEQRLVLDAGCGNGMLSYQAYRKGNRVLGVSIKEEVVRNQRLFNGFHGIPREKLEFRTLNLYDITEVGLEFDEIICCEVLEHIRGDRQVCEAFFQILKSGGMLHLCCPNAEHPDHESYPLDPDETGGHVRPGYTYASYKALLEPLGFELSAPIGLGGPIRQSTNKWITKAQRVGGFPLGLLTFAALAPWSAFEADSPRALPYSLYVQATKPSLLTSSRSTCG